MTAKARLRRLNPRLLPSPWGRLVVWGLVLGWLGYQAPGYWQARDPLNGFTVQEALVDPAEILPGGPGRDGIPAIDRPRFTPAGQARLAARARVLGISHRGQARAYPIAVLERHEIVNDRIGCQPLVISYCPLCGTGLAFRAELDGQALRFGVSGLLYRSNLLLYDRATESLWTQMGGRAVSGPASGHRLQPVPVQHTSWGAWRAEHPNSEVLRAPPLTALRQRGKSPYTDYAQSPDPWQPIGLPDRRLPLKERVIGVVLDGQAKAWSLRALARLPMPLPDQVGDIPVFVHYDPAADSAELRAGDGSVLPATVGYWFAWAAFHPHTQIGTGGAVPAGEGAGAPG